MRDVPIGRNAPAAVAPINFAARRREIVSCIVTPTLTAILVGWAFWVNRRCRRFLPSRLIFLTGSRFRRNSDRLAEQAHRISRSTRRRARKRYQLIAASKNGLVKKADHSDRFSLKYVMGLTSLHNFQQKYR